jgi:predicted ATP-grasp superfamily ATP-dependent carboligase
VTLETPAVVLGAGANGLGGVRSLARARVPAWLLDSDGRRAEMYTRAAKPLRVRALQGEALIEDLVRLGTTRFDGSRPVLLLTQEETVKTVSLHRNRLCDLYRFSLPPHDVVDRLQHKQGFQRLAEQLDAPVPPLVHVRASAELAALEKLEYPVVVKPGERHAEYSRRFKKAYRVESAPQAIELVRRILAVMPDVVVQEWIEGSDSEIYFCLQYLDPQSQVVTSFTGRKIRSWPPQVGGTASCTSAPEVHDELNEITARFFRGAGVVGMASMEYKRDARSRAFRMVEPTIGRTDYQEEVATLNGVSLPYAAYRSEMGLPFPAPSWTPRAVSWRVRSEDAQSASLQGQRPGQGYPRGGRVADALWRSSDPLPLLVQCLRRARHAVHARTTRIVPGLRPARSKS